MGVLRCPPSARGSFHAVQEDVTGLAEVSVHLMGVLREEAQATEKVKGLKRGHADFLKKMSPASMKSWISGLTFSHLDCTSEVQEGPQKGQRELSKQDGSAELWSHRRLSCSSFFFLPVPCCCGSLP